MYDEYQYFCIVRLTHDCCYLVLPAVLVSHTSSPGAAHQPCVYRRVPGTTFIPAGVHECTFRNRPFTYYSVAPYPDLVVSIALPTCSAGDAAVQTKPHINPTRTYVVRKCSRTW